MWDSRVNEWNSVAKGPHLNLLDLFAQVYREHGLKLLVAMHRAYHFTGFYEHVPAQSTQSLRTLYVQLDAAAENRLWLDKLKEVVDLAHPDILWQDVTWTRCTRPSDWTSWPTTTTGKWGKEVVATYKDGFDTGNGLVYDYERGGPANLTHPYWLTDDTIGTSTWCYTDGITYHSLPQILHSLIDRVSKNGTMLLNISPMADGTIPEYSARSCSASATTSVASGSRSTPPGPGPSTAKARPPWAAERSADTKPVPARTSGSPGTRTARRCTRRSWGGPSGRSPSQHSRRPGSTSARCVRST
jgi:alpha-L-fucosidase